MRGFDFMPVLFATLGVFVMFAVAQFFHDWPGAHNGLVVFERTCPAHAVKTPVR